MTVDDKQRETPGPVQRTPDKLGPSGAPTEKTQLAEVCARFADLCQYFSQQSMDLPPQIVDEVQLVSKLAIGDRIARMKRLNQELMEYLNDAGPMRGLDLCPRRKPSFVPKEGRRFRAA